MQKRILALSVAVLIAAPRIFASDLQKTQEDVTTETLLRQLSKLIDFFPERQQQLRTSIDTFETEKIARIREDTKKISAFVQAILDSLSSTQETYSRPWQIVLSAIWYSDIYIIQQKPKKPTHNWIELITIFNTSNGEFLDLISSFGALEDELIERVAPEVALTNKLDVNYFRFKIEMVFRIKMTTLNLNIFIEMLDKILEERGSTIQDCGF